MLSNLFIKLCAHPALLRLQKLLFNATIISVVHLRVYTVNYSRFRSCFRYTVVKFYLPAFGTSNTALNEQKAVISMPHPNRTTIVIRWWSCSITGSAIVCYGIDSLYTSTSESVYFAIYSCITTRSCT